MSVELESRMAAVERDVARLQERQVTAVEQLRAAAAIPVTIATLEGSLRGVRGEVTALRGDFEAFKEELQKEQRQQSEERKSLRIALIGLTATILAALLAAASTLFAAGVHP